MGSFTWGSKTDEMISLLLQQRQHLQPDWTLLVGNDFQVGTFSLPAGLSLLAVPTEQAHRSIGMYDMDRLHGVVGLDAHVLLRRVPRVQDVDVADAHVGVVVALEHVDETQAHGAVAVVEVLDGPAGMCLCVRVREREREINASVCVRTRACVCAGVEEWQKVFVRS